MAATFSMPSSARFIARCRGCLRRYLLPLGLLFYKPWILWAVVLFFLGTRHPLIYDQTPLDPRRVKLGIAALLIFFLSFSLVPVRW